VRAGGTPSFRSMSAFESAAGLGLKGRITPGHGGRECVRFGTQSLNLEGKVFVPSGGIEW